MWDYRATAGTNLLHSESWGSSPGMVEIGVPFRGYLVLITKDPSICGSTLGSPIWENYRMAQNQVLPTAPEGPPKRAYNFDIKKLGTDHCIHGGRSGCPKIHRVRTPVCPFLRFCEKLLGNQQYFVSLTRRMSVPKQTTLPRFGLLFWGVLGSLKNFLQALDIKPQASNSKLQALKLAPCSANPEPSLDPKILKPQNPQKGGALILWEPS